MDFVGAFLHSSPEGSRQMLAGLVAGAIVLSALVLSPSFRRISALGGALIVIYLIFTSGPNGVEDLFNELLTDARKYELFVKGAVAGKLLLGVLWQLKPSGRGASR